MVTRYYSSTAAETTLSGTINSAATSITIGSAVGLPSSTPFTLALDYEGASEELVEVTMLAGTTATITRAIDGTSATGHTAGARVRHVSSARDFSDSRSHENSDDGVHGLSPGDNLVGEAKVQPLTNKAISSSTWIGGSIGGSIGGTPTFTGSTSLTGGGALTGTFSGTHTFSGTSNYSGAANFSNTATYTALMQSNRTNATDVVLGALYGAFVNDTFRILANGRIEIGPGTGARDTFLYRSAVNTLKTDGDFLALGTATAGTVAATTANISGTATVGTVSANTVTNTATGIDYKPIVAGTASVSMTAVVFVTQTVNFGTTFPAAPRVILTQRGSQSGTSALKVSTDTVTTTGFTMRTADVNGNSQTLSTNVDWIAVTA